MARFEAVVLVLAFGFAAAFVPHAANGPSAARALQLQAVEGRQAMAAATAAAAAVVFANGLLVPPAIAITSTERAQLTYQQVKGTGLANRCNEVVGSDAITVKLPGAKLVDLCIEPKAFFVEKVDRTPAGDVKAEFVKTKVLTSETYTLDYINGPLSDAGGKLQFTEMDGLDYAPTTVQMPGPGAAQRVPFLFTVKKLVATGTKPGFTIKPGYEFGGNFEVPSYRTGLFLDPKGRGMTTGYDMPQALPGLQTGMKGDEELFNENNKVFDVLPGSAQFEVQSVNAELGEIGGVFVSSQPSDTDMGAKDPKKILLKGVFYGKIQNP